MVRADPMNPNAPEHLPEMASPGVIIKAIARKIFSDPDPVAAQMLNDST